VDRRIEAFFRRSVEPIIGLDRKTIQRLPPQPHGARRAANSTTSNESPVSMSDEGNVITDLDLDGALPNGADTSPSAGIISQYIKDLSVENPGAPESFQWTDAPQIDVQFNIGARPITDEVTEVELKVAINSKHEAGTAFIIDLAYCGLIGMRNLDEQQQHAFTYAEAPRILFPFARRIISDAVRDAGFPPLMLEPIDFNGIYMAQLAQKQAEEGADAPMGTA
jgi:preprotein translocase subunit SecB